MTRKIITSFVYPPIPVRTSDWCAYREGEEEAGRYGWGATEHEAIQDLIEMEDERFTPTSHAHARTFAALWDISDKTRIINGHTIRLVDELAAWLRGRSKNFGTPTPPLQEAQLCTQRGTMSAQNRVSDSSSPSTSVSATPDTAE